jgi:hypothetical protein
VEVWEWTWRDESEAMKSGPTGLGNTKVKVGEETVRVVVG